MFVSGQVERHELVPSCGVSFRPRMLLLMLGGDDSDLVFIMPASYKNHEIRDC